MVYVKFFWSIPVSPFYSGEQVFVRLFLSMNLLLFKPSEIDDSGLITLTDQRFWHVKKILRSKAGDTLKIGQINGQIGTGVIQDISNAQVTLKIEKLDQNPPGFRDIRLILALPRPPMFKRILSAVTSMGIKKIAIIDTKRVEKSFWHSHCLDKECVNDYLRLGLEQSQDTILPEVDFYQSFNDFLNHDLNGFCGSTKRLIAHLSETSKDFSGDFDQDVTIAIGPEGGFLDEEVTKFENQDFQVIGLGKRILRVETAVIAAIARFF